MRTRMRPVLFMRKKNLLGTRFYKYKSFSTPVKSVGDAIARGVIPTAGN